jgi:hypothetical protein
MRHEKCGMRYAECVSQAIGNPLLKGEDMSKNINVNPGQYKVAGRERNGKDVVAAKNKSKESIKAHQLREQAHRQKRTPAKRSNRAD